MPPSVETSCPSPLRPHMIPIRAKRWGARAAPEGRLRGARDAPQRRPRALAPCSSAPRAGAPERRARGDRGALPEGACALQALPLRAKRCGARAAPEGALEIRGSAARWFFLFCPPSYEPGHGPRRPLQESRPHVRCALLPTGRWVERYSVSGWSAVRSGSRLANNLARVTKLREIGLRHSLAELECTGAWCGASARSGNIFGHA